MGELQMLGQRNLLCGLHVHVQPADPGRRVELMARMQPFLPLLLALSTSSPFWMGHATGLMGYRQTAYQEIPRTGLPPLFRDQTEYDQYVQRMTDGRAIQDASFLWWALRPSRAFPTLELRVTDACTDLCDALAIAQLYRCLVRHLERRPLLYADLHAGDQAIVAENLWRAQRHGFDAGLIDLGSRRLVAVREMLENTLEALDDDIRALGCERQVERVWRILEEGTSAHAQSAAEKQLASDKFTLVAPFPAGGPIDTLARVLADGLAKRYNQVAVVDNAPGAAGNIGMDKVKRGKPDGHTLLVIPAGNLTVNPTLMPKFPFDIQKDFVPVAMLAKTPNVLVTNPATGIKTVAELIAQAKAKPDSLSYASPGVGSGLHLAGELFKAQTQTEILHVPYKGAPDILNDLYGGRISSFVTALSNAVQPHKAGKMRVLVTTSPKRSAVLPDVQTAAEAGFPQLTSLEWFGLLAPAGTSPERIAALNLAVSKAVASDRIKEAFGKLVMEPASTPSAEFGRMIKTDMDRWGEIAKRMNYQPVDA